MKKQKLTATEEDNLQKAFKNIILVDSMDIESSIDVESRYGEEFCLSYTDYKGKDKEIIFTINLN